MAIAIAACAFLFAWQAVASQEDLPTTSRGRVSVYGRPEKVSLKRVLSGKLP
jgi:hypothetical protein